MLFSAFAETAILASINDVSGGIGGVFGAIWGARCNPEPTTATYQMNDMTWHDDASIPSQGKTAGWRKVQVRVVKFAGFYILCPWSDVQLHALDTADIVVQIANWTQMAQNSVNNGMFPNLTAALRSFGMEHLSQEGFYAHERMHVKAVRSLIQTSKTSGDLKTILDEAAGFISTQKSAADTKALEIQGRLEVSLDALILAGFTHSSAVGSDRPPFGEPTAPVANEPMPATGVPRAVYEADERALTSNGYTRIS